MITNNKDTQVEIMARLTGMTLMEIFFILNKMLTEVYPDLLLPAIIPALILLHLYVSPYTKVEESFNIQGIHDILTYGIPTANSQDRFQAEYDHFSYPGAVPRTFVGPILLAGTSRPFIWLNERIDRQFLGMRFFLSRFYLSFKLTKRKYELFWVSSMHSP